MPAAQRESVRDFAVARSDKRLDIGCDVARRRETLGYSPAQLSESARVLEKHLVLIEGGATFEGSHEVACAALDALERLEGLRAGKAHLYIVS